MRDWIIANFTFCYALSKTKYSKMKWVQYPSQRNVDKLNTSQREASRHFRNKKKAYLKAKIEELQKSSKTKKIVGTCIGS